MYLYETHMHTYPVSACAVVSPEEMARHYKSKGYTGIIVTDHFLNGNTGCPHSLSWREKISFFYGGYERAKKEGDKCGLDVFFGLEYSFEGTDFLVYGLSPEYLSARRGFDKLKMTDFSAAVRAAGAYLAQAHPFRTAYWISNPHPVDPSLIDGIEVHNSTMPDSVNKRALKYAEKHNLAMQSGSDAHDCMRKPSGIILKKRANDIFDIITAIKSGRVEQINEVMW
jgi:predicted metal-dependent phosphoesterase TrpH